MPRLPWFAFYPSDWFRDTRCLSLAARGVWIDLLGILWDSPTRGRKSLDMEGWASEIGKPIPEVDQVFLELQKRNICTFKRSGNGQVTIVSRRQVRDEKARQHTRKRVGRFRDRQQAGNRNGAVTVQSQKSEVRSHISEVIGQKEKKRKKETHAMPENWSLTEDMKNYGMKKGMTALTVPHEFEHCKAQHLKKDSRFTEQGWSWQVWQTWVLNWISFGAKQVATQSFDSLETRMQQWAEKEEA